MSSEARKAVDPLGSALALAVAFGGVVYGVLFVLVARGTTDAVFRTWLVVGIIGGLVAAGVFAALYERLKGTNATLALWAVAVGVVGSLGQTLNASVTLGYDVTGTSGDTPDPLGMLRFGLTGFALILFGLVMSRDRSIPKNLATLGVVAGALLILSYVGRIAGFITPATKATLIPPLLYGLVIHPLFYFWLARLLVGTSREHLRELLLGPGLGRRLGAAPRTRQ
ncbi:MAG TPA: hypothetical protein VF155_00870 [Candidatus Dormibacteraeota bacterium]